MSAHLSLEKIRQLFEVPSTANHIPLHGALSELMNSVLEWDAPGDDAEYISELRVGKIGDPGMIVIAFSKWGNLCFVDMKSDSIIGRESLLEVLHQHGWSVVAPEIARLCLWPNSRQTIHDRFFNYI